MNKRILEKINELHNVLKEELPDTAVLFELEINGTSISHNITYKTAEQLKLEHISMRNIKGEFIK